ncbi:MAG: DNA/RNA non-specific endonuclease [Firmicutes bacterium]|nr:DNA/RNA non-specific endonuclease [Bacillota bacterium]
MKKLLCSILTLFMMISLFGNHSIQAKEKKLELSDIPAYEEEPFVEINDYEPYFMDEEKNNKKSFERFSDLDELGRCSVAFANIGPDLLPIKERESISEIKPSGWHSYSFDSVPGGYLYNRCHLIAYCLTGENANEKNLITGTRYFNMAMRMFEDLVVAYVEETGNHVLYRVTPFYKGDNLVCEGVEIEAWSVEDKGKDIKFNVFCYNVQPKVSIDYKTGEAEELYSNLLLKKEVKEEGLFNQKGDYIGNRAYIEITENEFRELTDDELKEFCEVELKEYEEKEYNYFSLVFENDRGVVFPACTCFPAELGTMKKDGSLDVIEEYIYISDEKVEHYTKPKEQLDAEKKEKEKITKKTKSDPRDSITVYVSVTGKYHSKSNCSGMKNYTTMSLTEAQSYGYSPCKKCN